MFIKNTLTILSYNVWMLDAPFKLGALDVKARAAAIPQVLCETGADVIALQEVWSSRHKKFFAEEFKKLGYEYSFYENAPVNLLMRRLFGNGLLIVSKVPIVKSKSKHERVMAFSHYTRSDEYFAGKGALSVDLQVTPEITISFYNTHLGAVSVNPKTGRSDLLHEQARQRQAGELFSFIKKTHKKNPIIVVGDFNTHYKIFEEDGLTHSYAPDHQNLTTFPYSETGMALIDSYHSINGEFSEKYTHDTAMNLYGDHMPVYRFRAPKRTLDYIYVSRNEQLEICHSEIVLTENILIPGRAKPLPLSDHFGILTRINLLSGRAF